MMYKFKTKKNLGDIFFLIEFEETDYILTRFSDFFWTPQKAQEIINGVEESKTKEKGEEYYWGNEDMDLYANKNGILLIDEMAQRVGEYDPDKITLRLTHDEFLTFMEDFKAFIEENS